MRALSLRSRLLAGVLLVAIVLAIAMVNIFATSRSRLVGQIDDQLEAATEFDRFRLLEPFRSEFVAPPAGFAGPERISELYEGIVIDGTLVTFFTPNLPGQEYSIPRIDVAQLDLEPGEHRLLTTDGVDGDVRYRVSVSATEAGTFVRALPLANVDDALSQMALVLWLSALAVLAVLGAVVWWVIHLGVRPIKEMTSTATSIAAGNLGVRIDASSPVGTESGELALALNKMLERIETSTNERAASEARLRRFVADASHELRTPLTTIRGYADLYRHGGLAQPPALDEAMRRTEEEASRMSRLVSEMLLLAKLDQERAMEHVEVSLSNILRDSVKDARILDPDRAIAAEIEPDLIVCGDDDRLRQVAANVVGNALIHTSPHNSINVSACRIDDSIVVEVTDQGPGMDAETVRRMTERFYRADPSRSRTSGGGSGLGMAIVDSVMRSHGGDVEIQSEPGRGTTVRLRLPAAPDEVSTA